MRHVLLQAFTASELGEDIAQASGNAHENNTSIDMTKNVFADYDQADMAVDYRNNLIGRQLGVENKGKSRLDIAKAGVEKFHKEGFWIAYKTSQGYELRQTKLGRNRYEALKSALERKDESARWIK